MRRLHQAVIVRALRNRVAHVCTPWEWQHRRSVVALVVVATTLFVGAIVLGFVSGRNIGNGVVLATVDGTVTFLLFVRPALRSLGRWDAATARAGAGGALDLVEADPPAP
jgi:hypothetical protein